MKRLLSFLLFIVSTGLIAQDTAIGEWRSHLSYNQARLLTRANSTIFCATENGLFSVNTDDNSLKRVTREQGLGSADISAIHYASSPSVIVIGYSDGVIDILDSNGQITTIKTLRDAGVVADKKIHDIVSVDQSAYLATDFGVVVLDLSNRVVKENFRNIGFEAAEIQVRDLTVKNDSLYLSTNKGLQVGSLNDNLLDFNKWSFFFETNNTFEKLIEWDAQLYVLRNATELWKLGENQWSDTSIEFPSPIEKLISDDQLYGLSETSLFTTFPSPSIIQDPELLTSGSDLLKINNTFWFADGTNGLLRLEGDIQQVGPAGPLNDKPSRLEYVNGNTYSFFGPEAENYDGSVDGLGYSTFHNGQWKTNEITGFYNITDVAAIGENLFFTSMGFGLYDMTNDRILNSENSEFITSNAFNNIQLSSIESFNNELFITSYNSNQPLYRYNLDNTTEFTVAQLNSRFPTDLTLTRNSILWVDRGTSDGGGITTFDPEGLDSRLFRISDGLPSTNVTGISIDYNDEAWISTVNGPVSYQGASFPFNDFGVTAPIFENGFLFQNEEINDILTDGGNRIWFATNQGVWVLSDGLDEVIYQFTTDNSPLLSNTILKFSYDERTGEVFILTDKGLISFRSDSSFGDLIHAAEIQVFPNPVLSSYTGKVGISGLARNASVKITDTKGRLVADLQANGGTAEWDVTNHTGDRVQTGVYLIFSSSADGLETAVGKIAVIQ